MITNESLQACIDAIQSAEVPQQGRYFEILGTIYGPDDEIPEHVKEIIRKLTSE